MTDIPPTATDVEPPVTSSGFNRMQAFRSVGFSIVVNAVLPYVIYRVLEPHYPKDSVMPLLISTVFPLFGLAFGMARRRTIDIVAVISLVEIAISIVVTVAARDVRLALIARALQGTLTGVFFLATIAVGRPLFYYVARQFLGASNPEIAAGFEAANRLDNLRTFKQLTAAWGAVTILVSVVNVGLAATVAPATYVLVAPILGVGSNVLMVWWTIRYSSRRLIRYADTIRSTAAASRRSD